MNARQALDDSAADTIGRLSIPADVRPFSNLHAMNRMEEETLGPDPVGVLLLLGVLGLALWAGLLMVAYWGAREVLR